MVLYLQVKIRPGLQEFCGAPSFMATLCMDMQEARAWVQGCGPMGSEAAGGGGGGGGQNKNMSILIKRLSNNCLFFNSTPLRHMSTSIDTTTGPCPAHKNYKTDRNYYTSPFPNMEMRTNVENGAQRVPKWSQMEPNRGKRTRSFFH